MAANLLGRRLPPAVVVMSGSRDQYHLPLALYEGDLLRALVTDEYWPADRKWFRESFGRFVNPSVIDARFVRSMGSGCVHRSKSALALSLAIRGGLYQGALVHWKDQAIGRKARRVAAVEESPVFSYSYYASETFRPGRLRPAARFLFQIHPHPVEVRRLLEEEVEISPHGRRSLFDESELYLPPARFTAFANEPALANGWVVASSYTAWTLQCHGVPSQNIHVVPYGVDAAAYPMRTEAPNAREPLTLVFVGSLIQRKGLTYLLDAVRLLGAGSHIQVLLCGRGRIDRHLLNQYADLNLDVRINLSRMDLVDVLHRADMFVFPSLVEGFAHVILEAMSCGLPVLATDHTCAADCVTDGIDGFVLPIRDTPGIAAKIEWGMNHREELAEMGAQAAARAAHFTWERFRSGIRDAYAAMMQNTVGAD